MEESAVESVVDYTEQLESISNQLSNLNITVPDYSAELQQISVQLTDMQSNITETNGLLTYATGFLLFIVVCILLKSVYKFFRLFF